MPRSLKKGPFIDLSVQKCFARIADGGAKAAGDQDLVATFDDHAGYGRLDLRRSQRQTPHSGIRYREYGRPQAGRIFADTDVQRTPGNESGEDGEKKVSSQQSAVSSQKRFLLTANRSPLTIRIWKR